MLATRYAMTHSDQKVIEPVLRDENIQYMHMILPPGEGLPIHQTNAIVYMTVASGTLTLQLESEEAAVHPARTVLKIPFGVRMDARNLAEAILELFVVKVFPKADGEA